MIPAVDRIRRTRRTLNQPPVAAIPGQLDLTRSDMTTEYTAPADRVDTWADMAADLAAKGYTHAQIAAALWIDECTVEALLLPTGRAA
ncbi:hypothetical protein [Streptomyces clavifer]|uniref:hypothetical protein n=1 Tax=Streptomyces clavifer TaxID=68188 RepID=UPI00308F1A26|nr:hypothetical protein OG388_26795 [Streptomyces clavifer]